MTAALFILLCVIATALFFDFTNGFHDTANAVASSIATGALKPKAAVALAAVMNLIGAFLSVAVALTVTNSVVRIQNDDGTPVEQLAESPHGQALLIILLAGLIGGILWNLFTWLLGLPSSSSHALFGGIIGSTVAAMSWDGVKWLGDGTKIDGVVGKIIMPALLSPLIAGAIAMTGTFLVHRFATRGNAERSAAGFRWGQIGAASLMSLAHGTNDAQKTMGVITLSLIAYGSWDQTDAIPLWVKVVCAVAIAAGTAGQVVLQIGGAAHHRQHGVDCLGRHHCAAEVGVQHGAGEIEHRPQRGSGLCLERGAALGFEGLCVECRLAGSGAPALECRARRGQHRSAAMRHDQPDQGGRAEQLVHRRRAVRGGGHRWRRRWRRSVGVEPTWDRKAAPPGFADRTPHRGTFLLLRDQPSNTLRGSRRKCRPTASRCVRPIWSKYSTSGTERWRLMPLASRNSLTFRRRFGSAWAS